MPGNPSILIYNIVLYLILKKELMLKILENKSIYLSIYLKIPEFLSLLLTNKPIVVPPVAMVRGTGLVWEGPSF